MNKLKHHLWGFRILRLAVIAIVMSLGAVSPTQAASTLYNMDRLLNEPHPFAQSLNAPLQPQAVPAAPLREPENEPDDLDMDDLGPPDTAEMDVNDPIEPVNRAIFAFNEILIKYLIGPMARGYNAALPGVARDGIRNFLSNLKGPVILANDLLQGEFKRGYDTTMRMVINSTAGVLGFIDVAGKFGFEKHNEDFGQTLAVWGLGEGFYLVLPVLGPSNPRDALGKLFVDRYFDPLGYYLDNTDREEIGYGLSAARGFTDYAALVKEIDDLRASSLDFYGALRSLYRQRRKAEISNGSVETAPDMDSGFD